MISQSNKDQHIINTEKKYKQNLHSHTNQTAEKNTSAITGCYVNCYLPNGFLTVLRFLSPYCMLSTNVVCISPKKHRTSFLISI